MKLSTYSFLFLLIVSCSQEKLQDGRIVKPFKGKVVFELPNSSLEMYIERPVLTEHGLFVFDKADDKIKLIDWKTNSVLRSYGNGRGRGPGEHEMFFNHDAYENVLAMVDAQLHRITLFNIQSGDLIRTIPVNRDPYNIFVMKNGLVYQPIGSDSLLHYISFDSDTTTSSASILDLDVQRKFVLSMAADYTSRDRSGEFIYIPKWDGRIFTFKLIDGVLKRDAVHSFFDSTTFTPSIVQTETGGFMAKAPTPEFGRTHYFFSGDKFYSPNFSHDYETKTRRYYYIDVYDRNFKYLYSYDMINEKPYPQRVTIRDNLLCFMGLENLRCYEMEDW